MSDGPAAEGGDAGAAQLTFKVKTSGDRTHTITMSESATVLELKEKLSGADFEDTSVDRQRLIYSGRIMKDADALSVYKIKTNNTIHLVKSARSNPAPPAASSSTPTPPAVPQNMAAGTPASNLLAGLTGARFAGHAPLPSRDLFGADGGMGPPPSDDEVAEMLSNPIVAQTMNEALNNPSFVDQMIQSNPMLASLPNAREMLQSPQFRNMMMNPEALRIAGRMRRMMGGGDVPPAFPAPGATDTTPDGAPASTGTTTGGNNAAAAPPFPFFPFGAGAGAQAGNPFLAFAPPAQPAAQGQTNTGGAATGGQTQPGGGGAQPDNPFAALFGAPPAGGAAGAFNPFGLPQMSPEELQQMARLFGGLGGLGSPAAAAPVDNRPPEERYAEQLRQLNDMGFFDFDQNVAALRRSGGSVQGAIEHLLGGS